MSKEGSPHVPVVAWEIMASIPRWGMVGILLLFRFGFPRYQFQGYQFQRQIQFPHGVLVSNNSSRWFLPPLETLPPKRLPTPKKV